MKWLQDCHKGARTVAGIGSRTSPAACPGAAAVGKAQGQSCRSASVTTVSTSIKPLGMNFFVFVNRMANTTSNSAMTTSAM